MHNSPILPQATKVAGNIMAGLIARQAGSPAEIRQAADWLHGAFLLADAIRDQEAADLIFRTILHLSDLAASHGTPQDALVAIGALLNRLPGQDREGAHD